MNTKPLKLWTNVINLSNELYATVARATNWGQRYSLGRPRNVNIGLAYKFQKSNMKNRLYSWLWKSHFIAGIIIVPFVLLLSVTGIIYLFKDNYEKDVYESYKTYESPPDKQFPMNRN